MTTYEPKTLEELDKISARLALRRYVVAAIVLTLIIGGCALIAPGLGKAIDQELGIYKTNGRRN